MNERSAGRFDATAESAILDNAYAALADDYRRHILYTVSQDGATDVEELTDDIAGEGDDRTRVQLSLVHSHLPRLDDVGWIDYDHAAGSVEPTDSLEDLEPFMDIVREWERDSDLSVN